MSDNQNALMRYFKLFLIIASGTLAALVILALIFSARNSYLSGEDTLISLSCNDEKLLLQITQDRRYRHIRYLKGHVFRINEPFVRIASSLDETEDYFVFSWSKSKNRFFPFPLQDFDEVTPPSIYLLELFTRGKTVKIDRRTLEAELRDGEKVSENSTVQCNQVSEGQILAEAKRRYKAAKKQHLEKTKDRKF